MSTDLQLFFSPEVIKYLNDYRAKTRHIESHHSTRMNSIIDETLNISKIIDKNLSKHNTAKLLIIMLYFGTPLRAEEILELTKSSFYDISTNEYVIDLPNATPKPKKIWIDANLSFLLARYINTLTPKQKILFLTDHSKSYTRKEIYQLVGGFSDEEEDSHLSHFFPIYSESDYSVIPTPLRLNADTLHTGRGVTIAFIDSGFYPHPDLTKPKNRIKAYINIAEPNKDDFHLPEDDSWHGMQTSVSATGNGYLSNGLYKAVAPDADVVLLKVRGRHGIQTRHILDAISWSIKNRQKYNIRIINISLSGDHPGSFLRSALDQAAEAAVQAGIVVVVAVGNSGFDSGSEIICPPASAPSVITVGGLNDNNQLNVNSYQMYWSSYGPTLDGILKPEIVAPGIWIAAPILPGSGVYKTAQYIYKMQNANDADLAVLSKEAANEGCYWAEGLSSLSASEIRGVLNSVIKSHKLVPPYYQHVDGTSFSAPIICSVIAQMLEANPKLTPSRIKNILTTTADKLYNVPIFRQGHGLVHPRKAVKEAFNDLYRTGVKRPNSPYVRQRTATFYFRSNTAKEVHLAGDFNRWRFTESPMKFSAPDLWSLSVNFNAVDIYRYKFVLDKKSWVADPENQNREPDGYGGYNTRVNILI